MRRPIGGVTLIEVMVAGTILMILSMMVVRIYALETDVKRRSMTQEEAFRQSQIIMDKLTSLFRGARTSLTVDEGAVSELTLSLPQTKSGLLVVDASGSPETAREVVVMKLDRHLVAHDEVNGNQILGAVNDGVATFQLLKPGLLEVKLSLTAEGERDITARREASRTFYLGN